MVDSVAVFPPGFRVVSSTGAPVSGAKLKFYDAGTTTPKIVHSDSGLSTSLGSTVTCDSGGVPASGAGAAVIVYTGTAAYKLVITDSSDVALWPPFDNVRGALDTSSFLTGAVVASTPVLGTKTADYTIVDGDEGKLIPVSTASGTVTLTLPSAVTVGDGWAVTVKIRQINTANALRIRTVSSQALQYPGVSGSPTFMHLRRLGASCKIVSNGASWEVIDVVDGEVIGDGKIIRVADRISAAPGSPTAGQRFIVTAPFDTWTAEQVIESDGAGAFVALAINADAGWLAYVEDENALYAYKGSAWTTSLCEPASDAVSGIAEIATQAEMEAATDTGRIVTPGRLHNHPGVAKWLAYVEVSGGTPSLVWSYNVASITDTGAGQLTVTIDTDFSSADWVCLATTESSTAGVTVVVMSTTAKTTGSVLINTSVIGSGLSDPVAYHLAGFGDQ